MRTIRSHEKDTQGLCHVVYVRFATPHGRQTRHVLARLKSALFVLFVFRECEVSYDEGMTQRPHPAAVVALCRRAGLTQSSSCTLGVDACAVKAPEPRWLPRAGMGLVLNVLELSSLMTST